MIPLLLRSNNYSASHEDTKTQRLKPVIIECGARNVECGTANSAIPNSEFEKVPNFETVLSAFVAEQDQITSSNERKKLKFEPEGELDVVPVGHPASYLGCSHSRIRRKDPTPSRRGVSG